MFNINVALITGFFLVILFSGLIIIPLLLASLWKIFKKAGRNGIDSIIPFYNVWVLVEITDLKQWFFYIICSIIFLPIISLGILTDLASLISLVGFFFCNYNLALKFEKDPVMYGIGLSLIPIVFYPLLAFSNAEYNKKIKVSEYGPLKEDVVDNFTKNNSSTKGSFCKKCGKNIGKDKYCKYCGNKN